MTYELRRYENSKYRCPRCNGETVKAGFSKGIQTRRCNDCNYYFRADKAKVISLPV